MKEEDSQPNNNNKKKNKNKKLIGHLCYMFDTQHVHVKKQFLAQIIPLHELLQTQTQHGISTEFYVPSIFIIERTRDGSDPTTVVVGVLEDERRCIKRPPIFQLLHINQYHHAVASDLKEILKTLVAWEVLEAQWIDPITNPSTDM